MSNLHESTEYSDFQSAIDEAILADRSKRRQTRRERNVYLRNGWYGGVQRSDSLPISSGNCEEHAFSEVSSGVLFEEDLLSEDNNSDNSVGELSLSSDALSLGLGDIRPRIKHPNHDRVRLENGSDGIVGIETWESMVQFTLYPQPQTDAS